ncbi:MAG: DNA polymerase III subunit beta [Alphaproteobacteria bacterium]|nr:DNA polymerase III subunit beta [Alphaproteobacteria bacterium]
MKLTIEKNAFQKALGHAHSVVERRTALPILSHLLLVAEGMTLKLTSTDLELSIVENVSATIQETGKTTVPAHLLHEIVRKFRDGAQIEIVHNKEKHQLEISSGRSHFKLPCLPPEDFPVINKSDLPCRFQLPAKAMRVLIERTRIAMSTEETRYFLNGIYLHATETQLRAVATDGHRLARVSLPLPENAQNMPGVIISRKTVNELYKLLSDTQEDVEIAVSENQISITVHNAVLTSRLIDGKYPDYEEAIPMSNDQLMHFKVREFSQAVDRVATISNERFSEIKMHLEGNRVQFTAVNEDSGRANEEIEVDYNGSAIDIGFNSRYLMDVAQQIDSDEAQIALSDGNSPIIIRPMNDDSSLFVLMPLRV